MLTADLVNARRKGTELRLVALNDETKARALAIAAQMAARISLLATEEGSSRKDVEDALSSVEADAKDQKTKAGLTKLLLDRCTFDAVSDLPPEAIRREVFERAAAARRNGDFVRSDVLAAVAAAHATTPDAIDRALFADLRAAHKLLGFEAVTPSALVQMWGRGQAQAVLLRATKIVVDVSASAGATRALFHKLKFLRLLHVIEKIEDGHRVTIDGPFSLFESATKYGLELAMVLPALDGCDTWSLAAQVLWGKARTPLFFRIDSDSHATTKSGTKGTRAPKWLADEVKELARAIESLEPAWRARPADVILELSGVGLCVPDLALERDGRTVYVESMGYWSRDAVWKRVELVTAGLSAPILFAVSERLRVSEAILPADASAALYVYKGTMHASAVLERVNRLWELRGYGGEDGSGGISSVTPDASTAAMAYPVVQSAKSAVTGLSRSPSRAAPRR